MGMRACIKRAVTLCIAMMMVLSLFTGCGTATEKPSAATAETDEETTAAAQGTAAEEEPVTIKVLTVTNWWFKGHDAFAELAAQETGVKIELEKLPDEQGVTVIKTRLATNDVPDILGYYAGANLKSINPEQQFLDLSDQAWANDIIDVEKNVISVDGKLYGSPSGTINMGGVVYNKKVYSELGLEIPVTWQELLDNCEKIKAAGKVPFAYTFKENWTAQLLNLCSWYEVESNHPDAAQLINTNKLHMADIPEYVAGFTKLNELREKGYVNKDYTALSFDNGQKMIANGDAAMYFMGSWIVDTLSANYPDKMTDLGGFALPTDSGDNGVTTWASGGWYIPKSATNPEAAKKWLALWATPEGQAAYYNVQKATGTPAFKTASVGETYDIVKDFKKYVDEGKAAMALEFQIDLSLSNDLPMICVAAGTGQKSPEQAAKDVDAALAKSAKDLKLPGW